MIKIHILFLAVWISYCATQNVDFVGKDGTYPGNVEVTWTKFMARLSRKLVHQQAEKLELNLPKEFPTMDERQDVSGDDEGKKEASPGIKASCTTATSCTATETSSSMSSNTGTSSTSTDTATSSSSSSSNTSSSSSSNSG